MVNFSHTHPFAKKCLAHLLGVTLFCGTSAAWADDYSEVTRLLRGGQFAEAVTKADQYLSSKPRDPQMRFLKGVAQAEQNKPNDAIATFTKLTEDYPELPEPYNNLAVLYAGQSQFDKARAALEMAIRTNPSYATAHENLGDVYAKLASQAYTKALQLDGGNTSLQPKLALIRDLFSPGTSKSAKPGTTPPLTAVNTAATALPKSPSSTATVASPKQIASATNSTAASATGKSDPVAGNTDTKDLDSALRAWAKAWSSKDIGAYLATYAKDFETQGKMSRKEWESERRKRIEGKAHISITLEGVNISAKENRAVAKFRQIYRADSLSVSSKKTLEWVKTGDRWLITKETTGS